MLCQSREISRLSCENTYSSNHLDWEDDSAETASRKSTIVMLCTAMFVLFHSDTFTGKPIINPKQIWTIYFILPIRKLVLDSRAEVMGWLICVEKRGIIKIKISSGTTTLPKSLNLQIWQVAVELVKAGRETAEPLPSGLLFLFSPCKKKCHQIARKFYRILTGARNGKV